MKLYKGKFVTEATKEQLPLMEKAGWTRNPVEEVVEDTASEDTASEDTASEDAKKESDEKADAVAPLRIRKKPIKKI